ncbi:hypothetical protein NJB1604_34210 [Mycobacterium marinum]|nr:hypothetical protein NJB1604_34210 [Mycobacterium marinum]
MAVPTIDVFRKTARPTAPLLRRGMPLPEPAAGLTSRELFSSLELFDRTRSCGVSDGWCDDRPDSPATRAPRNPAGSGDIVNRQADDALGLLFGLE